ncbi:transglutaminase-like cysteine peptidase [Legionella israelensis]|uniref:transglutaminase-like cysteine peptidase n=1 Tax=Legionella israelensis TaxID=454 RepID=UPI001C8FA274|nr:transglutaminase-like cysteine peptidase [Legionella israelensis]
MFQEDWSLLRGLLNKIRILINGCLLIGLIGGGIYVHASPALIISPDKIAQMEKKYKGDVKRRFHAWSNLIKSHKKLPIEKKLSSTNKFFNVFQFQSDAVYKGAGDYWKTPDEFIVDASGDCEDFSIAKYFTLLAMGVPMEKLRITYVKSLRLDQAHMILAYYKTPDAEPLILDNLEPRILPASQRPDLIPVYSFNGDGLWLAKQRERDKYLGQNRLSKWQRVIERIKQMGKRP